LMLIHKGDLNQIIMSKFNQSFAIIINRKQRNIIIRVEILVRIVSRRQILLLRDSLFFFFFGCG